MIVVQALMHYALRQIPYFGSDRFPFPNGRMDEAGEKLIKKFQRYLRKTKTRISVDGRIDPAKGFYTGVRKNLLHTIQQLNNKAQDTYCATTGDWSAMDEYIDDVRKVYPQVDAILSRPGVGTLNLGLE